MARLTKSLYTGYNVSAPGANTAITGGVTVGSDVSQLRITVALTTSSVLNLTATDGATAHKWGLNASAALNAADVYTFTHNAQLGLTYDIEVETDGVIEVLNVQEIVG